jgi:hypothetical protein
MKWKKGGIIVDPSQYKLDWMVTHAQNPFTEHIEGDKYKIHFAGRNKENMAQGGYVVVNMNNPGKILEISHEPYLQLGKMGAFDDCGAMPSCVVDYGKLKYLYYTGWTQQKITPFSFFIGLVISSDGGTTYQRYSKAPVLGRVPESPYLAASPWVLLENGRWRMWYTSGDGWEAGPPIKHSYCIKYAESRDGINWTTSKTAHIGYKDKDEYAIARPIVYRENGAYKMWYCYRGDRYRAGYAESADGITWQRNDDSAGIEVSPDGWDSDMICYPCVFEYMGKKMMLYNGNGYGKTGMGYAIQDKG